MDIDNARLSEQIIGLSNMMNAQFKEVHSRLDKINGKVGKHEEQITEALIERAGNRQEQKKYNETLCENKTKLGKIEEKIEKIDNDFSDVSFFIRHPKLFFAGISIIVILTLATFLTNNPLKVFDNIKSPTQTEITK